MTCVTRLWVVAGVRGGFREGVGPGIWNSSWGHKAFRGQYDRAELYAAGAGRRAVGVAVINFVNACSKKINMAGAT